MAVHVSRVSCSRAIQRCFSLDVPHLVAPTISLTPPRSSVQRRHYGASKSLTVDNMNPRVKKMEYAVRGKVLLEALRIQKELNKVQ